ncbi:unnamed protein product [Xylocopa violacea]|uniref:Uncharacterized protein n=1 Tax=Xylocopa violacea TaxID=135666 RepID=A0ABP1P4V2_XYLVO
MARRFSWCTVVALVVLLFVTTEGLRERNTQIDDHKPTSRGTLRFTSKSLEEATTVPSLLLSRSKATRGRLTPSKRSSNVDKQAEGTTLSPSINTELNFDPSKSSVTKTTRTSERGRFSATTETTNDLKRNPLSRNAGATKKPESGVNRRSGKRYSPDSDEAAILKNNEQKTPVDNAKALSRKASSGRSSQPSATERLDNRGPSVFHATTESSRSRTGRKIQTTYSMKDLKTQIPTSRRYVNKKFADHEATTVSVRRDGRGRSTTEKTERSTRSGRSKANNKENVSTTRRGPDTILSESESVRVDIPLTLDGTESPVPEVTTAGFATVSQRRSDVKDTRSSGRNGSERSKGRGRSNDSEAGSRRGYSKFNDFTTTEPTEQIARNTVSRDRSRGSDAKKSSASDSRSRSRGRNFENSVKANSAGALERDAKRKLVGERGSSDRRSRVLDAASRPIDSRGQDTQDTRVRTRNRPRSDVTTSATTDVTTTVAPDTTVSNDVTTINPDLAGTTIRPVTTVPTTASPRTTTRPSTTTSTTEAPARGRGRARGGNQGRKSKEDFFNHGLGFRGRKLSPEGSSNASESRRTTPSRNDPQSHGNPGWTLRRRPGHLNYTDSASRTVVPSPTDQTNEVIPPNEQSTSTEVVTTVEAVTSSTRRGFKKLQTADESTTMGGTTTKGYRRGNKTFGLGATNVDQEDNDNYPPEFKAKLNQLKNTDTKIPAPKTTSRSPLEDQQEGNYGRRLRNNLKAFEPDDLDTAASGYVFTDESLVVNPFTLIDGTGLRRVKRSSAALFAERSRMKLDLARRLVKPELNIEENDLDATTASSFSKTKPAGVTVAEETSKVVGKYSKPAATTAGRRTLTSIESSREEAGVKASKRSSSRKGIEDSSPKVIARPYSIKKGRIIAERMVTSISIEESVAPEETTKPYALATNPSVVTASTEEASATTIDSTKIRPIGNPKGKKSKEQDSKVPLNSKRRAENGDSVTIRPQKKSYSYQPRINKSQEQSTTIEQGATTIPPKKSHAFAQRKFGTPQEEAGTKKSIFGSGSTKPTFRPRYSKRNKQKLVDDKTENQITITTQQPIATSRYSRKKSAVKSTEDKTQPGITEEVANQARKLEFRPRTATYRRHSEVPTTLVQSTAKVDATGVAITPRSTKYHATLKTSTPTARSVEQEPQVNIRIANETTQGPPGIIGSSNGDSGNSNIFSPTRSTAILSGNSTLLEQVRSTVAPLLSSLGNRTPVFSGSYSNVNNVNSPPRITPSGQPPRFSARYKGAELFIRKQNNIYQPTVPSITSSSTTAVTPVETSGQAPLVDVVSPGEPRLLTLYQALESVSVRNEQLEGNTSSQQREQAGVVPQVDSNATVANGTGDNANNDTTSPTVANTSPQTPDTTANTIQDSTQTPRLTEATESSTPAVTTGAPETPSTTEPGPTSTEPSSNIDQASSTESPSASTDTPSGTEQASTSTEMPSTVVQASTSTEMPSTIVEASTSTEMPSTIVEASTSTEMPSGIEQASTSTEMPSAIEQASTSTEPPSSTEQVLTNTELPSSTEQVLTSTELPPSTEQVSSSTELPSSTEQVSSSTELPSSTEQVASSTELPSSTEQVASSTELPSSTEQVPTSTDSPSTPEQVSTNADSMPAIEQTGTTESPTRVTDATTMAVGSTENAQTPASSGSDSMNQELVSSSTDVPMTTSSVPETSSTELVQGTSTTTIGGNEQQTTEMQRLADDVSSTTDASQSSVGTTTVPITTTSENPETNTIPSSDTTATQTPEVSSTDASTTESEASNMIEADTTTAMPTTTIRTRLIDFAQDILSRLQASLSTTTVPSQESTTMSPATEISNVIPDSNGNSSLETLSQLREGTTTDQGLSGTTTQSSVTMDQSSLRMVEEVTTQSADTTSATAQGTAGSGIGQTTEIGSSTIPTTIATTQPSSPESPASDSPPITTTSSPVETTTPTTTTETATATSIGRVPQTTGIDVVTVTPVTETTTPSTTMSVVNMEENLASTEAGSTTASSETMTTTSGPMSTSQAANDTTATSTPESTTTPGSNETASTAMPAQTTPGATMPTATMPPATPTSQIPTTPYLGRFGGSRLTPAPRFSLSSTTRAPLRDYLVYGIYPNKTIVRKRPEDNLIDARNVDSPYVIFGIFPDGRLVRKFPNGTIIPDPPRNPVESNALLNTQMGTASIVSTGRLATDSQGGRIVQDRERDEATRTKEAGGQRSSVYIGQDKFVNYWTDGATTTNPRALSVKINSVATATNVGPSLSVPSFDNLLNNQPGGRVTAPPGFPWRDPLDQIFGITTSSPIITASVASNTLDDSSDLSGPVMARPINPFVEVFTPFSSAIGVPRGSIGTIPPPPTPTSTESSTAATTTTMMPSTTTTMAPTTTTTTTTMAPTTTTTTTTMAPTTTTTTTTMAPTTTTTTTTTTMAPTTTTTTMAPTTTTTTTTMAPTTTTTTTMAPTTRPTMPAPTTTSAPVTTGQRANIASQTAGTVSTSAPPTQTTQFTLPANLLNAQQQQNAFGTTFDDLAFLNSLLQSNSRSTTQKTLTQVEQLLANKILSLALNNPGSTRAPKAINIENVSPNSIFGSSKSPSEPIVIDLSPSSTASAPTWKPTEAQKSTTERSISSSTPQQVTQKPATSSTTKKNVEISAASAATSPRTTLISTTKGPIKVTPKPVTTPRPRTTTQQPLGFAGLLWQTLLGGGNLFGPSTTAKPVKSKQVKTTPKLVDITPKPIPTTQKTTQRPKTTTVTPSTTTARVVDVSKIHVNTNAIAGAEKSATTPFSVSTTKQPLLNNPNPRVPNVVTSTYSPEEDAKFLVELLRAVDQDNKSGGSKKVPGLSQDDESFLRAILSGQALVTTTPSPTSEISNAALLAALLKAQGIEPPTPSTNIREQLQMASLGQTVTSAPDGGSTTITTRSTKTATRPTDSAKRTVTPRPTSGPRIRTTTWSPSSTYPPPLFSSFPGVPEQASGDDSRNGALFGATRAFSQFLGAALSGAAQQLQSLVRNGTRIVSEVVG